MRWMRGGVVAFGTLLGLLTVAGRVQAGFSNNELQALYTDMRGSGAIQCGMTFEHLRDKYRECGENSMMCNASLVVLDKDGQCTDSLIFMNLGGREPAIILNGRRFQRRIAAPPPRKPMI